MRTTVDEMLAMGKEGFLDAMLSDLESKAQRPGLSPEERRRILRRAAKVKLQLAARRERQAVRSHAA